MSAPPLGLEWKPATSGNTVSWDGAAVVKAFKPGSEGFLREHAVLSRLTKLPVPRIQDGTTPDRLRLNYIDGLSAGEIVEAGRARDLLHAMGEFIRDLHSVSVAQFDGVLPGEGDVLVHGDFAPYNVIMSADGKQLAGVLDWEAACLGSRVMDLAWCEFQFKNRFPRHTFAVRALFEGYGETPPSQRREEALRVRLDQLRAASGEPQEP